MNANLITGLNTPGGIAVTSSYTYVANYGGGPVGVYTLDGVAVMTLASGPEPWVIAVCECSNTSDGNSGGTSSGTSSGAAISNITSGTSVSLSSINVAQDPVFSGGTLILEKGDNSSLAFTVTAAGGTITSPSSGSATLSGIFSGPGGLTFNGPGTTIFTGDNTYRGGTTVASGTLSVAGSSPTGTGDVSVASAGTLMGTGTILGNLTVAGTLKPGKSPGVNDCVIQGALGFVLSNNYMNSIFMLIKPILNINKHKIADYIN